MAKVVDLSFELADNIAPLLRMEGYDIGKMSKDEINKVLKVFFEEYFFNDPRLAKKVLKVKIKDV